MLKATPKPSKSPKPVPITPTMAPCTTKMAMMLPGLAPKVRKMAMSARLSVTVITRVETRLKAATITIRVKMIPIMRFSNCTAANQVRFCRVQSRMNRPAGMVGAISKATSRERCKSLILMRTPVGPSKRKIFMASSWCSMASVESYSKWPESKVPTTVIWRMRGNTPAGVT